MEYKRLSLLVVMIVATLMADALPAVDPTAEDIAAAKMVGELETAASNVEYGFRGADPRWSNRPVTRPPNYYGQTTKGYYPTSPTKSTTTAKPTKPTPCTNCPPCKLRHPIFIEICLDIILDIDLK